MEALTRAGIFTNIAPMYVQPLWMQFLLSEEIKYTFISSEKGHEGIKVIDPSSFLNHTNAAVDWRFIKNKYFAGALIYQQGLLKVVFKNDFDVYIFSGEMYNISTWIAAIICRLRKKPVFFWGHGYYGNERYLKKFFRLTFYKLANYHFLYGNRARLLLIDLGFKPDKLFTVYNSLDYNEHMFLYRNRDLTELRKIKEQLFPSRNQYPVLLFIGRLTEKKKISLLIKAIIYLKRRGKNFNCILVGNGKKNESLISLVKEHKLENNICFYGSCYDDSQTAKLIMLSDCCVSPGNVGLTAIHSMGLGTPVITHNNFCNQMPEVEAVVNGKTGFFFTENNVESLAQAIEIFYQSSQKQEMEADCIAIIAKYFNPENQYNIICAAIKASHPVNLNKENQKKYLWQKFWT